MGSQVVPTVSADAVGWLSEAQMIEVDRVMIEDLHIELVQMMENAGRNLARFVLRRFEPKSAIVLAGSGGNGGGGLVAARHLHNAGVSVGLALSRPAEDFEGVPGHQLDILQRMGVLEVGSTARADVAVDALVGYSLRGAPRGRVAELIELIPKVSSAVVALDTPSGLDVTTGEAPGLSVTADATVTLAAPKIGLRRTSQIGELYIADISVPPAVLRALGATPPDFGESTILRIS